MNYLSINFKEHQKQGRNQNEILENIETQVPSFIKPASSKEGSEYKSSKEPFSKF